MYILYNDFYYIHICWVHLGSLWWLYAYISMHKLEPQWPLFFGGFAHQKTGHLGSRYIHIWYTHIYDTLIYMIHSYIYTHIYIYVSTNVSIYIYTSHKWQIELDKKRTYIYTYRSNLDVFGYPGMDLGPQEQWSVMDQFGTSRHSPSG